MNPFYIEDKVQDAAITFQEAGKDSTFTNVLIENGLSDCTDYDLSLLDLIAIRYWINKRIKELS